MDSTALARTRKILRKWGNIAEEKIFLASFFVGKYLALLNNSAFPREMCFNCRQWCAGGSEHEDVHQPQEFRGKEGKRALTNSSVYGALSSEVAHMID